MTAQAVVEPFDSVSGSTYRAAIYPGLIHLSVSPDVDIADVLYNVLTPKRLRQWTVEFLDEDQRGWDCYLLTREPCVTTW